MTNAATAQVRDRLAPHLADDPDGGAGLVADSIADCFADPAQALRDLPDGRDAFALLCDPHATPTWALPWLAAHAGLRAAQMSLPEADLRDAVAVPEGHRRGTLDAVTAVARRAAPIAARLLVLERQSFLTPDVDLEDDLVVYARGPGADAAAISAAVNSPEVKPAGLHPVETYAVAAKAIVEHEVDRSTVGALEDAFATVAALEDDQT